MSGTATLGLEVRTSGLDNAVRQMNAFVSQADKAASVAARLEKTWSGVARMMSGFSKHSARSMNAMAKSTTQYVQVSSEMQGVTTSVGTATTKTAGQVLNLVKSLRGVATVVSILFDVISRAVQAESRISALNTAFEALIGTASGAREEMAWLRDETDRLGLNFLKLAESHKGLLAASRNTNLEGRATREIFLGVAEAGNALGLSTHQVQDALNAVQKIMSTGKVQASDLGVELEKHLPGAFRMAAEAMEVTEVKLHDMLKNGEVMAVDLLPKLARQLRETYGEAAVEAADSSTAALNRFSSAQENLMATLGGKLKPITDDYLIDTTKLIKNLNQALSGIKIEKIVLGYTVMKAVGAIKLSFWWKLPALLREISQQFDKLDKQGSDWVGINDDINETLNKQNNHRVTAIQLTNSLQAVTENLYEQIKSHSETTLETQIRHLDELAAKHKNNAELIILIERRKQQLISEIGKQIAAEHERLYNEEVEAANEAGKAAVAARDKSGKEIVESTKNTQKEIVKEHESSFQVMMKEWADLSKGWGNIAVYAMQGIKQTLYNSFRNALEGVGNLWENLWQGFKNIAYQVIAAIATKLASAMIAKGIKSMFPSVDVNDGPGGGSSTSGFWDWVSGEDSSFGSDDVDPFDSKYHGTSAGGMQMNKLWGGGGFGVGNAMGIVGGAMGMYSAYKSGDPMGGAMAGAALGTSIMPGWGTAIGAAAGLVAGMIGGDGDDTADREADARMFQELAEKIGAGLGSQKDYIEAIKYGHRSDNRVGGAAMEQLYAKAKEQGILEWWAPTPGQLGAGHRREYTDDQWKRYQVYGGSEEGEMGAQAFAELFGGAGNGGWGGGKDRWAQIKDVMEGLSDETIEKLGSSLGTFKDLATEWGVSIQDLLGPLIDADIAGDNWKEALEGLSAATLVQNAADAERAKGMNELDIVNNKVMRTIKLMAGWNKMDEEGKGEMIEMIRKDAGRREELMNASKRLKEVEDKLMGAHKLSKEETEKLAQEYADLSEKLGLNKGASADAASAAKDFADVMRDEVIPAIKEALRLGNGDGDGDNSNNEHDGGYIYHSGGMVGAMLNAGMITEHGGSPRMHHGGLRPDERLTVLQAGEFVIQRSSVNAKTLGALRNINATGRPPEMQLPDGAGDKLGPVGEIEIPLPNPDAFGPAGGPFGSVDLPDGRLKDSKELGGFMHEVASFYQKAGKELDSITNSALSRINDLIRQIPNPPKFHQGGMVPGAALPASAPTPQPKGGDNGRPVTINYNPQISVNAESGADAAKIEAAVTKALEKSRVALKRQLEQTGYQVVDAQ